MTHVGSVLLLSMEDQDVEPPWVQILVVVGHIQMGTLKAEVEEVPRATFPPFLNTAEQGLGDGLSRPPS